MSTEKRISHAFISFLLILCMVCTMFGFVSPEIVSAEKGEMSEGQSVNTILIYGKNKENKDVLLAHLDVEDLEKYLNDNINTSYI